MTVYRYTHQMLAQREGVNWLTFQVIWAGGWNRNLSPRPSQDCSNHTHSTQSGALYNYTHTHRSCYHYALSKSIRTSKRVGALESYIDGEVPHKVFLGSTASLCGLRDAFRQTLLGKTTSFGHIYVKSVFLTVTTAQSCP